MGTGIKIFMGIIGLIILSSWIRNRMDGIQKAQWLIGTWENKTKKGSIYETWTQTKDNEFSGRSYMIKDKDTIVFEDMRLVQEQGGLFYIPTVKNQNGGLPVRFAARSITEMQLFFENPQHDFPQVISYAKMGKDSLVAQISGTTNGQERKQVFPMKRVR